MYTIKKVGVLSVAKFYAACTGFIGLIVGILVAITNKLLPAARLTVPATSYLMSIILFPIFYTLFGFIIGAFEAWLYNLIAKTIGGVQIEFDKK